MSPPAANQTWIALRDVADQLGVKSCWYARGAFHFPVGPAGLTVSVRPESAGRFCVQCCRYGRPHGRKLWVFATDRARLARIVEQATEVMIHEARPRAHDPA